MTDLDAIAHWVNPGEKFASAIQSNRFRFFEKDVYFIRRLGEPTALNIDFFYRAYSSARGRLIVSGVNEPSAWFKHFIQVSDEFMEIDDDSFVFDKRF